MNETVLKLKNQLKRTIDEFAENYKSAMGFSADLILSDFGTRLEIQLPETLPEPKLKWEIDSGAVATLDLATGEEAPAAR